MKRELQYYDIRPKVVPADRESVIEIRPRFDGGRFADGREVEFTHILTEDTRRRANAPVAGTVKAKAQDGVLRARCFFEGEQEHVLTGLAAGNSVPHTFPAELRLYSVRDDLLARRPLKGDLHLHSDRSDGMETPAYVAAACRRIGLDFMALTDHHRYGPSLEAREAFAGVAHDLRIFPGEEVHPPDNGIHIVNFGGRSSVNELFGTERFRREAEAIRCTQAPVRPGVDPVWAAVARWTFDRIRDAGGLGIFCHPYWSFHAHYSLAEAFIEHLFDTQPFDAYELLGGFNHTEPEANLLQVARYHDERAAGRTVPIVGASDSHGCERGDLFGWYYTIAFAASDELPDVIAAIRDGYSVAVEAWPAERARPHGPFRLVKYALFLLREVFPLHDELCAGEGSWMHRHIAGDDGAADELARLSGRCAGLYKAQFAAAPAR